MTFPWSLLLSRRWSSRVIILVLPFSLSSTSLQPGLRPSASALRAPLLSSQKPRTLRPTDLNRTVTASTSPMAAQGASSVTADPTALKAASAQQPSASAPAAADGAASAQTAGQLPVIPVRVAIARGAKTLTIGGAAQTLILNQQGQLLDYLAAGTSSIAQLSSTGIQLGAVAAPSTIWVKSNAEQGLIYVDGHWYRGAVQVIVQDQTLLAVNHLDLETYLLSVVGAEMPAHWPSAALQAQAIAARSYALVHIARPASPFYDLGNTERWQVYRGVTTEANTTHAAVSETRGLILSHQGGVVESLYAASDEIVKEVHKGFGMSQEGANQMAQQGFNVQQILNTFYAGTQLAQLRVAP